MSCCKFCLQSSCGVRTGPATTLCCSEVCPQCGVCLPSSCPHSISLLQPTCCDTCPQPCCIPDSYVASCWLFHSCHPTPNLSGISVTTSTQPCKAPCC